MPTYYLYREKDKHIVPLGETSFNTFYPEDGWILFNAMVKNKDQSLYEYVIRRADKKDELSVDDFLSELEKYKLKFDNV